MSTAKDELVRIDVGPHRLIKEGDDLLAIYFGRTPTEAEMLALIEGEIRMLGERPMFLIMDFSKVETIPAPVRRVVGEAGAKINFRGVAMFGAGFQMRVLAKLVNSALALFRRQPFPQAFHDTREEAFAWVENLRSQQAGAV